MSAVKIPPSPPLSKGGIKVVMVDNYDSFTYNLVQYLGELGAEVTVVRNDQVTVADIEKLAPDKIVISPGPCTPKEAGVSVEAILKFAGTYSYSGRLSRPSKHRLCLWRQYHPCQTHHAWQNLAYLSSQYRRVQRADQSVHRHPLSFPGHRTGHLARLPGNNCLDTG